MSQKQASKAGIKSRHQKQAAKVGRATGLAQTSAARFSGTGVPPVVFKPRAGSAQTSVRAIRQQTKVRLAVLCPPDASSLSGFRLGAIAPSSKARAYPRTPNSGFTQRVQGCAARLAGLDSIAFAHGAP